MDDGLLDRLLPGGAAALERIASITPRESVPEAWLPVWQRLAGMESDASVARWAAGLGPEHPWYQAFLRGLIARSDRRLYTTMRGVSQPERDPGIMPEDPEVAHFHRLAGDDESSARRKRDAWLLLRTGTSVAGPQLAGGELEEFPELDAKAVASLDPAALDRLRVLLGEAGDHDWRMLLLEEIADRPAALERLEGHAAEMLAAYQATATPAKALAVAEALALAGKLADAEDFLTGKLPDDVELGLGEAHFLMAAGLEGVAPAALAAALDRHASVWLWISWLEGAKAEELAGRIERTMNAVDGRGPAAVAALSMALDAGDAAAIGTVLQLAKDLPAVVRNHAAARALWCDGRTAEVFALWPEEFPDYTALAEEIDLGPWEGIVLSAQADDFIGELRERLQMLVPAENATIDDLRALATLLLDPATTETFGIRRVRDAMVACSLVLAHDKVAGPLVDKMVDRARLAGASPTDCLRIEARRFMADGEFTAAYSRWLQLIDTPDAELLASDFLEAAACVFEDLQDAAAIELALRGKDKFPADPTYAYDGAWLLLTAGHPEEAGILLEHGFKIPFTADQQQTAVAMLLCAAEQTGRTERADQAFQELLGISPDWGDEEAIKSLEWPEALTENLLAVAARNR